MLNTVKNEYMYDIFLFIYLLLFKKEPEGVELNARNSLNYTTFVESIATMHFTFNHNYVSINRNRKVKNIRLRT